ncbi:MAG: aminoglycoside 6-adenylyltransferase [Acidimicrobiales bacterium]
MPSNLTSLPPGRRAEVEGLLDAVQRWAGGQADLHAVALVGSWARRAARADSDVDLVLLTDAPAAYLDDERWIAAFGARGVVRTQEWGVVTERRVAMASGLEVEFGVTSPEWASADPLDAGTRAVASDGLVALYDPEGLLAELVDAVSRTAS